MSISAAISNAVSGLGAVARGTQVVSSNLANVSTPGYAVRELSLSPRSYLSGGGGVQVNGIVRIVPEQLLAEFRLSNAGKSNSDQIFNFHTSVEKMVGTVNQTDSLHSLIGDLGDSLSLAAGSPDSNTHLHAVLDSTQKVSGKLNSISAGIQAERMKADQNIARDVAFLNDSLNQISKLNDHIAVAQSKGQDTASLLDNRQSLIDGISGIVSLKEVARPNGKIALFTQGGAALLDGSKPAAISFNASPHITPEMSFSGGQLFGITLNGEALDEHQLKLFGGGSIEAAFHIRDVAAPAFQVEIDAYAYDLYERFAAADVDITLTPPSPGIFTDQQASHDPLNATGFAGRIQVNAIIDPSAGGNLWAIRDGLQAANPGEVSDSSLIIRLHGALGKSTTAASPHLIGTFQSASSFASELMSLAASSRLKSQSSNETLSNYKNSLQISLSSYSVDSDNEIETLMQLEKLYSANAMVLQVANDMLDNILRIK